MVYEDEDDDEWLDESTSIMFAMAAEGERIRKSRQRGRSSLTRADLPRNPRHGTSWECIYAAGNDAVFIITTGFDVASFHFLLRLFTVCRFLGVTLILKDRYVNFGLRILLETLKIIPEGRIEWPKTPTKFAYYAELIAARHPSLHGAFCSIDGVKIPVAESLDEGTQNSRYNGWTCSQYCSSVFVFAPDGAILCALLNAPGSWHDAAVAQDLYGKLLNKTPEGYFAIADSAFPRSHRGLSSRIKTPLKKRSRQPRILREQGCLMNWKDRLQDSNCLCLPMMANIEPLFSKPALAFTKTLYEEFESMVFREIQASDRIKRYYDALNDAVEE
ncbi:hypothetical protein PPTG_17501 [Phytophthora nicotianae INRA-310]|uniref:DDE Tnp4 domain-containing protein n=1 Tax=Phytophthora nicotianae (strain INRA-310) TaxID=761204 RepID=W2PKA9_PHYN3|nr:hypothetical protein PPTG_17501 [Phytophthora nicotianae INRA-310]ETN01061.1 hypothetical protein PPTG_17501 [Phytophthora nicotianae INRA-310]